MPGTDQVDDRALSASHELKLAVEGRKALVDLELVLQQRVEALELGVLPQELGFVAYLSARPTIRLSISNIAPICFRCPRVLPRMPPPVRAESRSRKARSASGDAPREYCNAVAEQHRHPAIELDRQGARDESFRPRARCADQIAPQQEGAGPQGRLTRKKDLRCFHVPTSLTAQKAFVTAASAFVTA